MQVQIIPTLNVNTKEEFIENLRAVEGFVDMVQIDIADGEFANWKNWHNPEIISQIDTPLKYELHIMANNPIDLLKKWKGCKNIARIMQHAELKCGENRCGLEKTAEEIKNIFSQDVEIGFAVNPDTGTGFIDEIKSEIGYIMLLGVNPGMSGQKFNEKILEKIEKLRLKYPTLNIEVDGGINRHNIDDVVRAGANIVCLGSAIFNDKASPEKNYQEIKSRIKLL